MLLKCYGCFVTQKNNNKRHGKMRKAECNKQRNEIKYLKQMYTLKTMLDISIVIQKYRKTVLKFKY